VGLPLLTWLLLALDSRFELSGVLLLYLLVVVLAAAVGGPWPAAGAAMAAFAVANWYFVPPVHHWKINRASDLVALFTFVVVAAVVGGLVVRAGRQRVDLRAGASSAAALSEANEFRTAILAAVSHDLRTPLSSIKASVTSLRQHDVAWSPAAVDEFLATIDEESDRLDGLIGNLLDLSRLQTNTLRILERDVGLEEVAPAAIASLGELADRVDSDITETLPRVRVDPGLLERSLANIVANAVAWSPSGARVRIDATQVVADRIDLRIIDSGPGIPVEARGRVFEPFQRLGDRGTNGVGLGLAVARGFITAMDGELSVEDTPGGGTTMVVSLPVAP
jgi:two-component system sensor histidine kinase KdpD